MFDIPDWLAGIAVLLALVMFSFPIGLLVLVWKRQKRNEGWYVGCASWVVLGGLLWAIFFLR